MRLLPRLMLVTQLHRMKPDFESALEAALRGGARFIQLREKKFSSDDLLSRARRAQKLCEKYGAILVINGASDIAAKVGTGAHFSEGQAINDTRFTLRGASVHSLKAARRAQKLGADYLVFGSVFETLSHPGEVPAGLEKLREVCAAVEVPVFAIGGVTAQNARICLEAGAHGIAVIGAAWDADDVETAVQNLLRAIKHKDAKTQRTQF